MTATPRKPPAKGQTAHARLIERRERAVEAVERLTGRNIYSGGVGLVGTDVLERLVELVEPSLFDAAGVEVSAK